MDYDHLNNLKADYIDGLISLYDVFTFSELVEQYIDQEGARNFIRDYVNLDTSPSDVRDFKPDFKENFWNEVEARMEKAGLGRHVNLGRVGGRVFVENKDSSC